MAQCLRLRGSHRWAYCDRTCPSRDDRRKGLPWIEWMTGEYDSLTSSTRVHTEAIYLRSCLLTTRPHAREYDHGPSYSIQDGWRVFLWTEKLFPRLQVRTEPPRSPLSEYQYPRDQTPWGNTCRYTAWFSPCTWDILPEGIQWPLWTRPHARRWRGDTLWAPPGVLNLSLWRRVLWNNLYTPYFYEVCEKNRPKIYQHGHIYSLWSLCEASRISYQFITRFSW